MTPLDKLVQVCPFCEARSYRPEDNLHCAGDGAPHAWHTCGDIFTHVPGSDCPEFDPEMFA